MITRSVTTRKCTFIVKILEISKFLIDQFWFIDQTLFRANRSLLSVRGAQNNLDDDQPLDSYQEYDLEQIRAQWTNALDERQKYLNMQISASNDTERESTLIQQLMLLTEERNAVLLPAPNSNIPGAPCDWTPPSGIEKHIPVVFLDVNG